MCGIICNYFGSILPVDIGVADSAFIMAIPPIDPILVHELPAPDKSAPQLLLVRLDLAEVSAAMGEFSVVTYKTESAAATHRLPTFVLVLLEDTKQRRSYYQKGVDRVQYANQNEG